jgi:hypothetical protein
MQIFILLILLILNYDARNHELKIVIQYCPVPCHFIPLRPKFLQYVLFEHVSLCSPRVRDQDSQASETTDKIKVLFI